MASFTAKTQDPQTNFLRSQRGVVDNSASQAVNTLGTSYLEHKKDQGLSEARSATERLQKEFLSQGETSGGGGGGGGESVVTQYAEKGGDPASVSALQQFNTKIERLKQVSQATGGAAQYQQRAEALLKSQINRMPGLSAEFRQIASGILGTGGALVKEKIAQQKEQRETAKAQLKEFNEDAKSLGLMPHEVQTKSGQIKYMRRAAMRSKIMNLEQMNKLNEAKTKNAIFDPKYMVSAQESTHQTNLTNIQEQRMKRKENLIDPDVVKRTKLDAVPAYSQRNRQTVSRLLLANFSRLGGEGDSIPSNWASTLDPDQRKHIKAQIQAAMDQEKEAMATDGSMEGMDSTEYSRISEVRLASFKQALTALDSEQDWKDMENHNRIQNMKIDNKIKDSNPMGVILNSWARNRLPIPAQQAEKLMAHNLTLLDDQNFLNGILPRYNQKGESKGVNKEALDPEQLDKLTADHTFAFITKLSADAMDSDDPEIRKHIGETWKNIADIYNPASDVVMKKGALDSLVDVMADPTNVQMLQQIIKAEPVVRASLVKTMQRHNTSLIASASNKARIFLHQGLVKEKFLGGIITKETKGSAFIEPVLSNNVLSFKLADGVDGNIPEIRSAMGVLDGIARDANKSMMGLKNFGVDEQKAFETMLQGSIWSKDSKSKPKKDRLTSHVRETEKFTAKAFWDHKQFTNGYGTKAKSKDEVITEEEARRRFDKRIQKDVARVEKFVPEGTPPGIKEALASLSFNAGTGWMKAGLGKAVKNKDWEDAKKRFLQYNKAGGKVSKGLVARREAEAEWFDG